MHIVFMGTPDFAVTSLRIIAESQHQIVGVVTRPDRPKGRGLRLTASPVKIEAEKMALPITQPEKLNDISFLEVLRKWNADCFVIVGFRILPPEVFEMPKRGTINLHASLLPKYRGAAPIQWAIINGEQETGVTTFFIQKKVDTGDLILQRTLPIEPRETAGTLHDKLAEVGSRLLLETLDLIEKNRVEKKPQVGPVILAPKIQTEHCAIDWHSKAKNVVNLVRGLSPQPGAFTLWEGKRIKIFNAICVDLVSEETVPGKVIQCDNNGVYVDTSEGTVRFNEIQVEGKRRMRVDEFLRGHRLEKGAVFISPSDLG